MTHPLCCAMLVLLIIAPFAPAATTAEEDALWQAAARLLHTVSPPSPTPPVAVGQPYQFESFSQGTAADLRRAISLLFEKQPPDATVDEQTDDNRITGALERLFEYYPLVARAPQDYEALRNWIFDPGQPPALRNFLLERAAPGMTPPSAFAHYFQGHLTFDDGTFEKRLLELIQLPQESKPVQRTAMDAQLARARAGYRQLLARDPQVAQRMAEGDAVTARQLIDNPEAITMTRRTALLLERHSAAVGKWAYSLKGTADNPQRDASVRAKARETLEAVLGEFPIPNRDTLVKAP